MGLQMEQSLDERVLLMALGSALVLVLELGFVSAWLHRQNTMARELAKTDLERD